ncbi:hypothetical protein JTE90_019620, partial [Oedothorax gibbosus]
VPPLVDQEVLCSILGDCLELMVAPRPQQEELQPEEMQLLPPPPLLLLLAPLLPPRPLKSH